MALAPFRPFGELHRLRDDMNRFFNEFFGHGMLPAHKDEEPALEPNGRTLPIDMVDHPKEVVVRAMVPGVDKENLSVSVSDGTLTISGEQKVDKEAKEGDYYREYLYGKFYRRVNLPTAVDEGSVKAKLKDGVLDIHLPKVETAKPTQIEIGT